MDASETITDKSDLRSRYGKPSERSILKQLSSLDKHCRAFIGLSPFIVIGTMGNDGFGDVSPRGDAPGFVFVHDDTTLIIPDRPGNNRTDTLGNLLDNAGIGLLFLVPGMDETLRVNGVARIITDQAILKILPAHGKLPKSAILVDVKEAYLQCAKALVRSKLWSNEHRIDRKSFPTLGQILTDQMGKGGDPEETEHSIQEGIRNKLY